MLVEPGFKVGYALLEFGGGLLELSDLLLLEPDGQEAGTDEGRHGGGVAAQSAAVRPASGASSSIATVSSVRPRLSITHVGHPQPRRERLR